MGDLIPFQPVKRTIHRLAKEEIEQMNELYRITEGYRDPTPCTDIDMREQFHLGVVDEVPWE